MATTPQKIFISLRLKILVAFTLVFGLVFAAAFWWFYLFSTGSATEHTRDHVQTYLNATALGIKGDDLEQLIKLAPQAGGGAPNNPAYQKLQLWLQQLHIIEPKEVSYVFVKGARPGEILWVGDGDLKRQTPFMTRIQQSKPDIQQAFEGSTINSTPYHDRWGDWVSGYMPVLNSRQQVVGGIGVDFSARHVLAVQQAIRNRIWLVFSLTYVVLFAFVYYFSRFITRPITQLTQMASQIGEGNYNANFGLFAQGRFNDEISILGNVFTGMVGQVQQREQTLKREVQDLRIEIDDTRKARQVKEIVDTEFFRDLKSKAQTMRTRAKQSGDKLSGAPEVF